MRIILQWEYAAIVTGFTEPKRLYGSIGSGSIPFVAGTSATWSDEENAGLLHTPPLERIVEFWNTTFKVHLF